MIGRRARLLLGLAAVAVAFAAADTYVVVLALQDMVSGVGGDVVQLQKAAPIVSGFLLGYVAMLPLIGRIADLRGRVPVLLASLVIFAAGSAVTALAYDMLTIVLGRFVQGVGGGGLVPATLALVADLYPADRRGVPLGVVSAVQEIGAVLGPVFGAVVLAVSTWRMIFVINLVVALVLAFALRALAADRTVPAEVGRAPAGGRGGGRRPGLPDVAGLALLVLALAAGVVVFVQPAGLRADLTWGAWFVPVAGSAPGSAWTVIARWLTPIGALTAAAWTAFAVRMLLARRPLIDVRSWWRAMREADLAGAAWLAVALGGVVLAFATADPRLEVFSDRGWWYLALAAIGAAGFVVHGRRAAAPLVPRGALRARGAWGSLVVSGFVGAALIAALVDIPIFARTTIYPSSQVPAALVLVRFLLAVPVGALAGGYLTRRWPPGVIAALGMVCAAVGFVVMARWQADALRSPAATLPLLLGGLGFGLALAPINAAVLACTDRAVHGLASALVVVARMVGMLVGISALTTLGLRRLYAEQADMPAVTVVCGGASRCPAFEELLRQAALVQEHTVFLGAAGCAVIAAVIAVVLLRTPVSREAPPVGIQPRRIDPSSPVQVWGLGE